MRFNMLIQCELYLFHPEIIPYPPVWWGRAAHSFENSWHVQEVMQTVDGNYTSTSVVSPLQECWAHKIDMHSLLPSI